MRQALRMRATRRAEGRARASPLGLALAACAGLALAACTGNGSAQSADGGAAGGGMEPAKGAAASAAAKVELGATRSGTDVVITVRNGLAHPIALLAWGAVEEGAAPHEQATRLPGTPASKPSLPPGPSGYPRGFGYTAIHQVDDPGPAARAPMPDRLHVPPGPLTLVTLPVVPAGATWTETVPLAGWAHAAVRYAELAGGPQVLRLEDAKREELTPPSPEDARRWGWVDVATYTVVAWQTDAIEATAPAPAWPKDPAGIAIAPRPGLPRLCAYGLFADVLDGLPSKSLEVAIP